MDPQTITMLHRVMLHQVLLGLWGGVVAAELVMELLPRRYPELHEATAHMHYWIDLLIELPVVLAVTASGVVLLVLVDQITAVHLVKTGLAGVAVAMNITCIAVVVRRERLRRRGAPASEIERGSRLIVRSAVVGLPCALGAVALGLWLGLQRWAAL